MDFNNIKKLHKEALAVKPRSPNAEEVQLCRQLVTTDRSFNYFIDSMNVDDLVDDRINFIKDLHINYALDTLVEHLKMELSMGKFAGSMVSSGSLYDDTKLDRINQADYVYVLGRGETVRPIPSQYVAKFGDCIERIMENIKLPGGLQHGGFLSPAFSGVRYNGPAIILLFIHPDKSKHIKISLNITPVFSLPEPGSDEDLAEKVKSIREKMCLINQQCKHKALIYSNIYLAPNLANDTWQITTAAMEAQLIRDLTQRAPFKLALIAVKVISHNLNKVNADLIFGTCLAKLSECGENKNARPSTDTVSDIIAMLKMSRDKVKDTRNVMRYAHAFLPSATADQFEEFGRTGVSLNTTALKQILLKKGLSKLQLFGEPKKAVDMENMIYNLVTETFELLSKQPLDSVPHAFIQGGKVNVFTVSKSSLIDNTSQVYQQVLIEECTQIYQKIRLLDTSNANTLTYDSETKIVSGLEEYILTPTRLSSPEYHYEVTMDASITLRRDPIRNKVRSIANGCLNSCGGQIKILLPREVRERVINKWLNRFMDQLITDMTIEIFSRFVTVQVEKENRGITVLINITPLAKPIKIDGHFYSINKEGLVMADIITQTSGKCLKEKSKSPPWPRTNTGRTRLLSASQEQPAQTSATVTQESSPARSEGFDINTELKGTRELSWTKNTNNWKQHLVTEDNSNSFTDYPYYKNIFVLDHPFNIYPSVNLLTDIHANIIHAFVEGYSGEKGFLIWSEQWSSLLNHNSYVPVPPGHMIDVLCVTIQDRLELDMWSVVDYSNSPDVAVHQSYVAQTGRALKWFMLEKMRHNGWVDSESDLCFDVFCGTHNTVSQVFKPQMPIGIRPNVGSKYKEKQLSALCSVLLDTKRTTTLRVSTGDSMLVQLSYLQSKHALSDRRFNYIEGPPGSGKSVIASYVCDQYGKDKTAFFCTLPVYKAYVEYQDKAMVYLIEKGKHLKKQLKQATQKNVKCVIIDDVHNLSCNKESWCKFLDAINKNKQNLYVFCDNRYQNYKTHGYTRLRRWFIMNCFHNDVLFNDPDLPEIHRNTQKIASFLSADIAADNSYGRLRQVSCVHSEVGHDVKFLRRSNLTSDGEDNGLLLYLQSLLSQSMQMYEPKHIAVLVDSTSTAQTSNITMLYRRLLTDYLPTKISVHGADVFPRKGIVVDTLDNFVGLDTPVCVFPILPTGKRHRNIFYSKYKMFIASRAVYQMVFLMEEAFNTKITDTFRLDKLSVPDYRAAAHAQTYGQSCDGVAQFANPWCIASCPATQHVLITDREIDQVHVLSAGFEPIRINGNHGTDDGMYDSPSGIAVYEDGHIFVADQSNHRIQVLDKEGTFIRKFGSRGTGQRQLDRPKCVALDQNNKQLYVCEENNITIQVFSMDGMYIREFDVPSQPYHIALSPDGVQLVMSGQDKCVYLLTLTGVSTRTITPTQSGITEPRGVTIDPHGNVIVADWAAGHLVVLRQDGSTLCTIGRQGEGPKELMRPQGITLTATGDVLVCDTSNKHIHRYNVPQV